jgi:hypothetical protein
VLGITSVMSDEPTTQELRLDQIRKEREQRHAAESASEPAAARSAERRADKAAYLREKLEEQEDADAQA